MTRQPKASAAQPVAPPSAEEEGQARLLAFLRAITDNLG